MTQKTKIEWTDRTWNPIRGCSPVSPGCANCYAARMALRLESIGDKRYQGLAELRGKVPVFTGKLDFDGDTLQKPLRTTKPSMWFVNSMSDLFHEDIPFETIDQVVDVMGQAYWHTFQVLTKRAQRMAEYFRSRPIVPKNVWLGVSVEDARRASERLPHLADLHARTFVSAEPLLGPIVQQLRDRYCPDWIIVGGESGPHARPMHPAWAVEVRDFAVLTNTPFFFKQWGEWAPRDQVRWFETGLSRLDALRFRGINLSKAGRIVEEPSSQDKNQGVVRLWKVGKKVAGRLLNGREWNEMPVPLEFNPATSTWVSAC